MGEHESAAAAAKGCPFHSGLSAHTGASLSSIAERGLEFDVFGEAYQLDPAEALRWARAQAPVFYSAKLGYWVVTRYADVKAIFRDVSTFSPSIALEKITPTSPEAGAILAGYNYAMNRTLVNEDEPAHMERRRALMQSFVPLELAHHESMVRRLTKEYIDRFIDRGRADLVNEMLWEIPLQVALHFLGVPEEDMETLRLYSIAHTVNTWGRPTSEEQLAVAESVGKFWQYSGHVLEKMRAEPDGGGWMHYAIRKQRELPEIVTDSYLHSMMMAGIVAAHETTAHAAANAIYLLLRDRDTWNQICADPALIPNAIEECLRLSGSIIAWRRLALEETRIAGVTIPKDAKLLIVMASANHDERKFENPDALDIFRENTVDHLTFGYGSHQCMGKNLARMEMRIFLEEFTKRLPHMDLVPDQKLEYLPNVSFRGPDHLHVQWDPSLNPERSDCTILNRETHFPIGAPTSRAITRPARVSEVHGEAADVLRLVLEDPQGRDLPDWTPGAHIDVRIGDFERKYSLCGEGNDRKRMEIAILRDPAGSGGSAYIHDVVRAGDMLRIRGPKNHFQLEEGSERYLLIAGGIGITPIIVMADRLKALGKDYVLHYAGRSKESMAFIARLQRDHGERVRLYPAINAKLDLSDVLSGAPADTQIYACGPERLLQALDILAADRAEHLHVERFSVASLLIDPRNERGFDVDLADSGLSIHVAADQTLLQALRAKGIDVPSDCEEGLCGSCEVSVLAGEVDHRDAVLTLAERRESRKLMACCSRAYGKRLKLAL